MQRCLQRHPAAHAPTRAGPPGAQQGHSSSAASVTMLTTYQDTCLLGYHYFRAIPAPMAVALGISDNFVTMSDCRT